jgi:hypothetical protein
MLPVPFSKVDLTKRSFALARILHSTLIDLNYRVDLVLQSIIFNLPSNQLLYEGGGL